MSDVVIRGLLLSIESGSGVNEGSLNFSANLVAGLLLVQAIYFTGEEDFGSTFY